MTELRTHSTMETIICLVIAFNFTSIHKINARRQSHHHSSLYWTVPSTELNWRGFEEDNLPLWFTSRNGIPSPWLRRLLGPAKDHMGKEQGPGKLETLQSRQECIKSTPDIKQGVQDSAVLVATCRVVSLTNSPRPTDFSKQRQRTWDSRMTAK